MKFFIRKRFFTVLLLSVAIATLSNSCSNSLEDKLKAYSRGMNAECPITIDEYTRLDGTLVVRGSVLQMNYTITQNFPVMDTVLLKQGMKEENVKMLKNKQNEFITDNGVTVQYHYYDSSNNYLFSVQVDAADYK